MPSHGGSSSDATERTQGTLRSSQRFSSNSSAGCIYGQKASTKKSRALPPARWDLKCSPSRGVYPATGVAYPMLPSGRRGLFAARSASFPSRLQAAARRHEASATKFGRTGHLHVTWWSLGSPQVSSGHSPRWPLGSQSGLLLLPLDVLDQTRRPASPK